MKTNNLINVGKRPYIKKASFTLVFLLSFLLAGNLWATDIDPSGNISINQQSFSSTTDNFNINATGNGTITLTSDITIGAFTIGAAATDFTLDLAGYTLTCSSFSTANFSSGTDVIDIDGGGIKCVGTLNLSAFAATSDLVVGTNGATITSDGSLTMGAWTNTGALTVNSGASTTFGAAHSSGGGATIIANGDVVFNAALTDGISFTGTDSPNVTVAADLSGATISNTGVLNVNNLTVTGASAAATLTLPNTVTGLNIAGNLNITDGNNAVAGLVGGTGLTDIDVAGTFNLDGSNFAVTLTLAATSTVHMDVTGLTTIDATTGAGLIAGANTDAHVYNFDGGIATIANATNLTLTRSNVSTIIIDGPMGNITNFPDGTTLGGLTINDTDGTPSAISLVSTGTLTVGDLKITKGKLATVDGAGSTVTINESLTMANDANAILDLSAATAVANAVTLTLGDGTANFSASIGANAQILTDEFTVLSVADKAGDVTLPASVNLISAIGGATTNKVSLSGDLEIRADGTNANNINLSANGTLVVGSGNKLTITTATNSTLPAGNLDIKDAALIIDETAGGIDISALNYLTNSKTDFTLKYDAALQGTFPTSFKECKNFTLDEDTDEATGLTLGADLHIYGNLALLDDAAAGNATTLTIGAHTLIVDGTTTTTTAGGAVADVVIDATDSDVVFNGPIDLTTFTLTATATTDLTFGGSGTLGGSAARLPVADASAAWSLGSLTVDRPGEELRLQNDDDITLGALTVTSGTIKYYDNITDDILTVSGNVEVGQHGELVVGGTDMTGAGKCEAVFCTAQDSRLTVIGELFLFGKDGTELVDFSLGYTGADPVNPTAPGALTNSDNGQLQVTGTFAANEYANVTLAMTNYGDSKSVQLNLPATFDRCNSLLISTAAASTMNYTVKLQGDLEVTNSLTLVGITNATGSVTSTLVTSKNSLTVNGDVLIKENGKLDASEGNLVIGGALETDETVTSAGNVVGEIVFNENTNADLSGDLTLDLGATNDIFELNTLILRNAADLTLTKDLICHGNLEVYNGTAGVTNLTTAGFDITVYGDMIVSNDGTTNTPIDFTASPSNLNLYGNLYDGDHTTAAIPLANLYGGNTATNMTLNIIEGTEGSSSQFTLPTGLTAVKELKLKRTAGMKMFGDLAVGNATGDSINIQRGNIDLNGKHKITLGHIETVLAEVGGDVINTGVDGGYIETQNTTATNIIASNIGITEFEPNTAATIIVRRYPRMTVIEGDYDTRISVQRYYTIVEADDFTSVTFRIDDDELGNNSFSGLEVYRAEGALANNQPVDFTNNPDLIDDDHPTADYEITHNSSYVGYGTVKIEVSGAVTDLINTGSAGFAFGSQTTTNGEIITFNNAAGTGLWNDAGNWDLNRIPTIEDEVIISVPTLVSETAGCFAAASMVLNGTGTLRPSSGDTVCIQLMGNIELTSAGNFIKGNNGTGRLNFFFGDAAAEPVSVRINPAADYDSDSGIMFHDITLNNANVTQYGSYDVFCTGDLELNGVSVYDATGGGTYTPTFTFYGGYEQQQDIVVDGIASASFYDIVLDNNANVYTNNSIGLQSKIELTSSAARFVQEGINGKAAYLDFAASADVDGWDVFEGAYCQFDNLTMAAGNGADITPYGNVYIMGNFSFTGTGATQGTFNHNTNPVAGIHGSHPDGNAVIFTNESAISSINHGSTNAASLKFDVIKVLRNCSVETVSDFYIQRAIYVENDGSFVADAGDITMQYGENNVDKLFIENKSDHTLWFYNLVIPDGNDIYTYSDFNIQGDFTMGTGTFDAYDGTITFNNTSTKSITNGGSLFLHGLKVPEGSRLTTATDFHITNNGDADAYKDDAGIFVTGNGSFKQTAGTVTFTTLANAVETNPGEGNPKTIEVSEKGNLVLNNVVIANAANNDVTTKSNFNIGGTTFTCSYADLGGTFVASDGSTITFDGQNDVANANATIVNARGANDNVIFDNILFKGTNGILAADDYLTITGDIIINGDNDNAAPTFVQAANTAIQAHLKFTGEAQQKLTGNTTATTPITFEGVEIIKGNEAEVLMDLDVTWNSTNTNTALYITEGFLNLGSKTLTLYNFGSGTNGAYVQTPVSGKVGGINGAKGTVVIAENIGNAHNFLRDYTFLVDGKPTLYNLTINVNENTDNDLTVNNDLTLNATLDVTAATNMPNEVLTVWGNISGNFANAPLFAGNNTGTLKLLGTGTFEDLSSANYMGSATTPFPLNLYIGREEVLSGNLYLGAAAANNQTDLIIDCGVNTFDLGGNLLQLQYVNDIARISGSITANNSSEVVWSAYDWVMPSNLFTGGKVGTLDLEKTAGATIDGVNGAFTIEGDLTVNTELKSVLNIYTLDNVLEFGPTALVPVFSENAHIIGNLRRTLNSGKTTEFPLGDGTAATYRPLEITSQNTLTNQTYLVSTENTDPTVHRGGEPDDAINNVWNITAEGDLAKDNVEISWTWDKSAEDGVNPAYSGRINATQGNATAARWDALNMKWVDYKDKLESFIMTNATDPRSLSTNGAVIPISETSGAWGIFTNASENASITDDDTGVAQTAASQRADAVATAKNRVQISRITNLPVGGAEKAQMTVQLQDQFGQPITTTKPFEFTIREIIGTGGWDYTYTNVIPAGESMKVFDLNYTTAAARVQLVADTTGGSDLWLPTTSQIFSSLAAEPTIQANNIKVSNITASSADIEFTNGQDANTILMIKADALLDANEYPSDGVTYQANTLLGAGSSIGKASVIYKDYNASGTVNTSVYGLAPQTQYYIYAFNYGDATTGASVAEGSEAYTTKSGLNNPKPFTTTGTIDDDLAYGNNDSRAYAKSIGTNSPVRGTIKTTSDEDWYCFTVTSAAKNIRATLVDLPGNYNFDIYNISERRLRRAIRHNDNPEAAVVNDLPPGTYVIRVYGTDGAYSTTDTYELMIETKGSEVFSVTP